MNVQEYIASGILESYVLGLTAAAETAEVEAHAQQFPEIASEIAALRTALEEYALAFEQEPPAALRGQVLAKLAELQTTLAQAERPDNGRAVAFNPSSTGQRSLRFSWMVAASWGFLLLSLLGNALLYSRWQSSETRLSLAEAQNTTLAQRVEVQQARYIAAANQVQDPATRKIELKGTPDLPNTRAVVFYNAYTGQVYLTAGRLPATPAGKQYQLWAIVGGKAIDAGVFDLNAGLVQLKNTAPAQAFAISLEATGGSTTEAGPKGPVVLQGGV